MFGERIAGNLQAQFGSKRSRPKKRGCTRGYELREVVLCKQTAEALGFGSKTAWRAWPATVCARIFKTISLRTSPRTQQTHRPAAHAS